MDIDDREVFERLPAELRSRLEEANGFVAYDGGLHVRGACREPDWHSLHEAWLGEDAFHRHYPELRLDDVPFAEDCVGDQYLLRDGQVMQLSAETGELEALGVDLDGFFAAVEADPVETLGMDPLLQFQQLGGKLEPGQLISVYPPFVAEQSADGVSLAAISARDRHDFLWSLAEQLRDLPDGATVRFEIE